MCLVKLGFCQFVSTILLKYTVCSATDSVLKILITSKVLYTLRYLLLKNFLPHLLYTV